MENIKVDFSTDTGKVKPMHAVNNGSVCKFRLPVEYKHHLLNGSISRNQYLIAA